MMDTFENEQLHPEQQETEATIQEDAAIREEAVIQEDAEVTAPLEEETSLYHGAGAGRREETYAVTQEQPAAEQSVTPTKRTKKKRKAGKVWKGILAAVLALLVIAGSCTATAYLTTQYWQNQNNAHLQLYIDQKVQAILNSQNDSLGGTSGGTTNVVVTVDGLSASQIYEKNIGSVVAVTCTVVTGGVGQNYQGTSAGSGFILSEDGYIVTNYHVVEGATSINVTLANGKKYACVVRGYDETNDVAVLKAEVSGLTPVTLGKSGETKVGDPVVAIGNALGELSFSLTVGYISGVDRQITTDGTILNMLQTDAAINSGNSGGPLFNAKGEVIGITTAKYSGTTSSGASIEGISFAIPMDDVSSMIWDLKEYGYVTGAYLGISVSDVDPAAQMYGVPAGAYVHETVQGYCAAKAGMQAGDIIVEIGGYQVTGLNSLSRALRNFKAGDAASVKVWRGGKEILLTVVFDEKPQA